MKEIIFKTKEGAAKFVKAIKDETGRKFKVEVIYRPPPAIPRRYWFVVIPDDLLKEISGTQNKMLQNLLDIHFLEEVRYFEKKSI